MPTLIASLPATLNQQVSLVPESSPALCADVEGSTSYKKKQANAAAPKPKEPQSIPKIKQAELEPIGILQTLGLAMLPPRHVRWNLASWHWTLMRYAYLIEPASIPYAPLATNALVGDYRFHHMTALSEAFGVGCALSYAQSWLGSQIPKPAVMHAPIDFDYLLGSWAEPLPGAAATMVPQLAPNATRQPDYVIVAEDAKQAVRLMIVECKGNSGSRTTAVGQLGSAMHQLASIQFTAGQHGPVPVVLHAYAACVSKQGAAIDLYGVDPPDDAGNPWVRPAIPTTRDMPDLRGVDKNRRLLLPSVHEISGRALRRLEDRTIAWAGAGDGADEVDVGSLTREESEFGDVVGAASALSLPDGDTIEIFTGALVDVLEAAKDSDTERAHAQRMKLRSALHRDESEQPRTRAIAFHADRDPERIASVIDDDGLVLRIEVTSEHSD